MALTTCLQRIQRLDQLISMKATGTPQELAHKMRISKRAVHDYITLMKDLGAPIYYCKTSRSYRYSENGRLYMQFKKN